MELLQTRPLQVLRVRSSELREAGTSAPKVRAFCGLPRTRSRDATLFRTIRWIPCSAEVNAGNNHLLSCWKSLLFIDCSWDNKDSYLGASQKSTFSGDREEEYEQQHGLRGKNVGGERALRVCAALRCARFYRKVDELTIVGLFFIS